MKLFGTLAALITIPLSVFGTPISISNGTNAVVGEAAADPFITKVAVAEAIRNRGTLRGVYGFRASHNKREPRWVWAEARAAWIQSIHTNLTHGARFFGNLQDVRKGTFLGMTLTCIMPGRSTDGHDSTYFFRDH